MAEGTPQELSAQLGPHGVLHATALGSWSAVAAAVRRVKGIQSVEMESEENGEVAFTARSASGEDLRAAVSQALAAAGCAVLNLTAETLSLEDIFLELTEPEEAETDNQETDDDTQTPDASEEVTPPAEEEEPTIVEEFRVSSVMTDEIRAQGGKYINHRFDYVEGDTALSGPLHRVCDHAASLKDLFRPERHEPGVTGSDANAVQLASHCLRSFLVELA